ncbi:Arb2 domain-containing protein [Hypoxylon sp. NC1633]|nr:Arb2 domain-containing protein [Hypoxylon sp. NC1633]
MFRRKWSGLPADPQFPVDIKELGYFINEDDEVRSIENPDYYFKFFLNRNERWNDRQRYAMNQATQGIIWDRLEKLDMKKVLLPLGTTDPTTPHVPIFVTRDIAIKTRIIVIFGESMQDLGILAHRIIGGPGGVNRGSMVSIVSALQKQHSSPTDPNPPGVILANMGELIWWPAGNRTLSSTAFDAVPMKSAVHNGNAITDKNRVPGNEDMKLHVNYIFDKAIPHFLNKRAKIDVVGLGDGADVVEEYLDLPPVWEVWKDRINCLALVGGLHPVEDLRSEEFKVFLRNKARAYAPSLEPVGTVLSGPDGNPRTSTFTQLGCPIFSSGEQHYMETLLIQGSDVVLSWLQEVADTPPDQDYKNPEFEVLHADPVYDDAEPSWGESQTPADPDTGAGAGATDGKSEGGEAKGKGKDEVGAGSKDQPRLILIERPRGEW